MTRRRIYLCAALYAEGPSDYEFLSPLIQRLLDSLGNQLFPGMVDVGDTIGIDAPKPIRSKRSERIAAAVADHWNAFTLLVVHTDGAGAPDEALQNNFFPGIKLARSTFPSLIAIPCVPVREIEAWMLADNNAFQTLLGRDAVIPLPTDPAREMDPKQTLQRILLNGGLRRGSTRVHRFMGEEVRFDALRKLTAFQQFELELCEAIQAVAKATD